MQLATALGNAFLLDPVVVTDGTSSAGGLGTRTRMNAPTPCPGTTTLEAVTIPTGWTRHDYHDRLTADGPVVVTVTIPNHHSITLQGTAEVDEIPVQFTGWSFDPTDGTDDGRPGPPSGPGDTSYSVVYLCKHT